MLSAPCKDCPERKLRCHARCVRYAAYVDDRQRIYAERLRAATEGDVTAGYQREKKERLAKRSSHA